MHTPGTWIRDGDEIGIETLVGTDRIFLTVCELREPSLYHTADAILQTESNARLIIKAPEMLDFLRRFECNGGCGKVRDWRDEARALLREIEG